MFVCDIFGTLEWREQSSLFKWIMVEKMGAKILKILRKEKSMFYSISHSCGFFGETSLLLFSTYLMATFIFCFKFAIKKLYFLHNRLSTMWCHAFGVTVDYCLVKYNPESKPVIVWALLLRFRTLAGSCLGLC